MQIIVYNYIANIYDFDYCYGISYADVSTGEVYATLLDEDVDKLLHEVVKKGFPEIIVNDTINREIVEYSSSPRVATGVGFQWQSPMGQIDVDFAVPVVKEKYDKTEVFRLNFGTRL